MSEVAERVRVRLEPPIKGWAGLRLELGSDALETSFSYTPQDSILALAAAAVSVLSSTGRRSVVFHEEPSRLELVLDRSEGDLVRISAFRHADNRIMPEPEPVLGGTCRADDFGKAMWRALRSLQESGSPELYAHEWHHPFPVREVELLGVRVRT